MSYIRVIPRDLFNEANLLKCYGKIYINLEMLNLPGVELEHDGDPFDIRQDESSGAIYAANVHLMVRGSPCTLMRPLNSREPWPLIMVDERENEISVFDDEGNFSPEMLEFLRDGEREVPQNR